MWRVNLPRGVKSIPNPRLTPRIVVPPQVAGRPQDFELVDKMRQKIEERDGEEFDRRARARAEG